MEEIVVTTEQRRPKGWRAIVRVVTGIGLVILGIVGLILPVMPGWIFLIPGLIMIGDYFPPAKWLVDWGKARFDYIREAATAATSKDRKS